jgi:hypothetical protein
MTNDWEKAHVEACRTIQALMARVAELEAELADERANGPTAEEWRRTHERAERAEVKAAALCAELRSVLVVFDARRTKHDGVLGIDWEQPSNETLGAVFDKLLAKLEGR